MRGTAWRGPGTPHRDTSSGWSIPIPGQELADGTPGELRVRGYGLMLGYYKKPTETAESYDEDGWFCTGDMGERHADGHIRFLGRFKDMLKVGGENVDPMEVEGLLLEHPAVRQVAVVGLPDRRLSEVAVAFVERQPDIEADEADILAYCRGQVASFKIPRRVFFLDALPHDSLRQDPQGGTTRRRAAAGGIVGRLSAPGPVPPPPRAARETRELVTRLQDGGSAAPYPPSRGMRR